jgi:predicted AlkP superfamily phosphohydrolase/phosphomutase
MSKVFVIGIDAGNLELIKKWQDDLPNFSRLLREGASGKLESTIPPSTMPAWNCIFTGKNPGKLGIYGFVISPQRGEGEFRIASYMYQDAPSLWDILGDEGKKVGVVNVPTVFPPTEVNGFMVAGGLLTPLYKDTEYTFPPELKQELNRVTNGYEVLPFTDVRIPGKEKTYLERFKRNIEKQTQAVKHLITTQEWDFLTYVFYVTDSAQHYFWHHMDETHPRHNRRKSAKYKDAIKEVYQKVDTAIGNFLSVLPQDTTVLIVSDHGTAPAYGNFAANAWLMEKGFLSYRPRGRNWKIVFRHALVWIKDLLSRYLSSALIGFIVRCTPNRLLKMFLFRELYRTLSQRIMEIVDWKNTKAYSLGMGSIFINLEGREAEGIVKPEDYEKVREDIIAEFLKLNDPQGRKPKRRGILGKASGFRP